MSDDDVRLAEIEGLALAAQAIAQATAQALVLSGAVDKQALLGALQLEQIGYQGGTPGQRFAASRIEGTCRFLQEVQPLR